MKYAVLYQINGNVVHDIVQNTCKNIAKRYTFLQPDDTLEHKT